MAGNKEALRSRLAGISEEGRAAVSAGKIAEQVRRLEGYRAIRRLFIAPAAILHQVRINALADGKELLMPAPGLKEDFFLLLPGQIPFADRVYAVSNKGLVQHGRRIASEDLAAQPLGLLLTDCLAVDRSGVFLGDGKGFFDLCVAIFAESDALAPGAKCYAAGARNQVLAEAISPDPWDVQLNGFLSPEEHLAFGDQSPSSHRIFWEQVAARRIRKMTPLWKLARRSGQLIEGLPSLDPKAETR